MWASIQPLFTFGFWFHLSALPFLSWASWVILIYFGLLTVMGTGVWFWIRRPSKLDKERRKVVRQGATLVFWVGVTGLFLYWCTLENIPLLSMRIWFLVDVAVLVYGKIMLAKRWLKTIPAMDKARAEREAYEKWLPKPKKH